MGNLTALKLKNAAPGRYQDGAGLFIDRTETGGRWTYRYSHLGKRRDMGLGSYPTVSLSDARQERDRWKVELAAGRDPINVRREAKDAEVAERDKEDPTLFDLTHLVFESMRAGLRGGGARGRWLSPFTTHLFPALGRKRASQITAHDIRDALKPIWRTKHPTAEKAHQRLRIVLREGYVMGFDTDPIVADRAARMLGEVNHIPEPTPATPWQEMPALYAKLPEGSVGQCLRFMMLTLVRLDGCAGARFDEVEGNVWTVPPERMKGKEGRVSEFRVPLPPAALDIVSEQAQFFDDLLFAGMTGRAITSRSLERCLDRLGEKGRPHGFRTSFRMWVQDSDACSWEVAETVLAHSIGNKVERTYARSDLLERRALVMAAWASFVIGEESADVVPIKLPKA